MSREVEPVLVIVLCGKRKAGKDHVAASLQQMQVPCSMQSRGVFAIHVAN